ncbi:type II toxin-antitoxin system PemK/MazF family toxin [Actinospongicola halichondriae]|uniref:type II toxin-antitoxin system PemK/MazF family toxin n=1 Tax=Actinospongicola halichondriae TaxID=3236844 RepID=UPI003D4E7A7B
MLRGDVYRFRLSQGVGHEQHGDRYGIVVQANELLPRSVVVVAPTSTRPGGIVPTRGRPGWTPRTSGAWTRL